MAAHGTIGGSRIQEVRGPSEVKTCPRCGVERKARKNARMCADCVAVISPAERRIWSAA